MLSRREWIIRFLLLPSFGAVGFAKRGAAEAVGNVGEEAAGKVSKEAAKYQDHPNNMQMCGMCKFYIPPGGKAGSGMMGGQTGHGMMGQGMMGGQAGHGMMGQGMMGQGMMAAGTCEVVEGQISPMGWCALYQPLSS